VANKEEEKIEITDVENCSLCKSCVRKAKELGSRYIKIGYRENDFIFNIETDGSMPPKEVLLRACDVLNSKTDEFIDFSKGGSE
jgi:DNA-directed RNA polymerase subunit D